MAKNTAAIAMVVLMLFSTIGMNLAGQRVELNLDLHSKLSATDCDNQTINNSSSIHVDNQLGNDSHSGSAQCPLASVTKAVSLSSDNQEIVVYEGVYHESIMIDGFQNLTVRSAVNNRVVFDGTRSITNDLGGVWNQSSDGIHEVDLGIDAWQVFKDYQQQVPARWPNANFSDYSVLDQENNWAHGTIGQGGQYSNGAMQDSGGTSNASNGLVDSGIDPVGAIAILNVGSFRTYSRFVNDYDANNSTFFYDTVPTWKNKHHHYFLEGKRELIDVEGEWWINSTTDRLHMLFANGSNPNDIDIRVKTQAFAFNITNSDNVSLQGLEFFATTFRSHQCDGCSVIDSDLMYPSTSKRGLGIAGEDVEERWVSRMDRCSNCLIDNSSFAHTDGSAIEFHGAALQSHNNTINNSHFEFIDWSASDLPGLMVTIFDGGKDNTFSNNTIRKTGASATVSIGDSPQFFFNKITQTGFIQSDGAVMQMMMAEQAGAEVAYNWIYNTAKYGIRMDGPAGGTNTGNNASVHHNVLWDIKTGIMVKGNYHHTHNNTVFGNDSGLTKNQIIVLFENGAGNENSTTANNAADTIAAHRSSDYTSNPVPGTYLSNYNGYDVENGSVESMLVDPRNFDFRPIVNSTLDNLSAGAYDADDTNPWTAGASRVWQVMVPPILGCTDQLANNFDNGAGIDDHSCDFDLDDDGVLDIDEVDGCTNSTANNFDVNATDDDGSCDFDLDDDGVLDADEIGGCTNSTANNFDVNATDDDGSCDYDLDNDGVLDIDEIVGCKDSIANNYNPNATEDGICDYDLDDDGVLDGNEVEGCTNSTANNFNQLATDEDGSCDYDLDDDGILDVDDNDTDGDGVLNVDEVYGCTNELANNFDSNATENDGSCDFDLDNDGILDLFDDDRDGNGILDEIEENGCSDIAAINYNPSATIDDGSCTYLDYTGGSFQLFDEYSTTGDVISSKFSPDGTRYATLHSNTIYVWNTSLRTVVDSFSFSSTWDVFDLDWSPDGNNISIIMNARSTTDIIKSWIITYTFGVENYSYIALEVGTHFGGEIEYSPDGSMIAVAYDKVTAIYNSTSGEELWNVSSLNYMDWHNSVSWSPDGLKLAATIGDTVYIYNVNTQNEIRNIQLDYSSNSDGLNFISSVSFSPDGTRLAYCSHFGESYLSRVNDGVLLWKITYDRFSSCTGIVWSPDSQRIATSYFNTGDHASAVVVQDANDGSMVDRIGALRPVSCEGLPTITYRSNYCGIVDGLDWHNNGPYILHSVSGYNAGIYHWFFYNNLEVILGCTIESATNYNPFATTYDASCTFDNNNNANNGGSDYYYDPYYPPTYYDDDDDDSYSSSSDGEEVIVFGCLTIFIAILLLVINVNKKSGEKPLAVGVEQDSEQSSQEDIDDNTPKSIEINLRELF